MTDFMPNLDFDRQIMQRIEEREGYVTWPRDQLKYFVDARGAANVSEWQDKKLGWYRPNGPHERMISDGTYPFETWTNKKGEAK